MKILNIGPMELVFILIIVLIVLGPKDMVQYGRKLGKFIREFRKISFMARSGQYIPGNPGFSQKDHA